MQIGTVMITEIIIMPLHISISFVLYKVYTSLYILIRQFHVLIINSNYSIDVGS